MDRFPEPFTLSLWGLWQGHLRHWQTEIIPETLAPICLLFGHSQSGLDRRSRILDVMGSSSSSCNFCIVQCFVHLLLLYAEEWLAHRARTASGQDY
eukprot:1159942-Pelagomonas_calceolata.AAC.4